MCSIPYAVTLHTVSGLVTVREGENFNRPEQLPTQVGLIAMSDIANRLKQLCF